VQNYNFAIIIKQLIFGFDFGQKRLDQRGVTALTNIGQREATLTYYILVERLYSS